MDPILQDTGVPSLAREGQPLVSIVMIFRDAERFIEEAIASVLAQTVSHWELLLVDDGSTDRSTALARSYVGRMPKRIRYLEHAGHERRGTGASRNAGMAAARGDYIAFLDSDDVYLPTRIERHLATFRDADHADIVVSGEIYWWSWNSRTPADVCEPADLPFVPSVSPGIVFRPTELLVILLELAGAATPSICSITFRRRLFADFGGVPERFAGLYEDQALIAKLLLHGRAVVLDECLAKYRQHPDSLTYAAIRRGEYRPGRPHLAERLYLDWLGEAAADQAVLTPRLARALGRLRWPYDHPIAARLHLALRELGRASRRSLRMLAEVILPPKPMAGINARLAARRRRRAACHAGDVEQSVLGERRNG